MDNPMLRRIRAAIGRSINDPIAPRPPILPSRVPGVKEAEIEMFFGELEKLSASGKTLDPLGVKDALADLTVKFGIKKATMWKTPLITELKIADALTTLGVALLDSSAGKRAIAECDLGITEVVYILPETGTIVLPASDDMPRVTSLLPRVHLAIAVSENLRADLAEVFEESKESRYFVFISGPSRTADIEMTPALGVHGPRELIVWMVR